MLENPRGSSERPIWVCVQSGLWIGLDLGRIERDACQGGCRCTRVLTCPKPEMRRVLKRPFTTYKLYFLSMHICIWTLYFYFICSPFDEPSPKRMIANYSIVIESTATNPKQNQKRSSVGYSKNNKKRGVSENMTESKNRDFVFFGLFIFSFFCVLFFSCP